MSETGGWVLLLASAILFTFFLLFALFWLGWKYTQRGQGTSPYTGLPLRYARELSYFSMEKVWRYLDAYHQYDNQPFKFGKSSFCRETGRIFPNSVSWFEIINVDWRFLQKRHPGHYVSWGSLNKDQQEAIRVLHESLNGFNIHYSSPEPAPRAIEPEYAYASPGPLYVDLETNTLLGWKVVPETDLEVLIVQKPKKSNINI